VENISKAMDKCGRSISKEELKDIMKAHDVNGDGGISFEEFKRMMVDEDEKE
jgi:Ca2+-binding EF-hand superfamily protein